MHFVTDSGSDCLSPCKYYYECAYCDEISTEDTWTSSENGPHDLDANSHCRICDATLYGINVGECEITRQNATDVFGDGKVSYDKTTNTLTLNGYTYTGDGIPFAEDEYAAIVCDAGINIKLVGENTIETIEDINAGGIVVLTGDCTISGTGTLTVLADGGGITAAGGSITVKSGKIVLGTGLRPILVGIMGSGVTIEGGDIDIIGSACGIYAMVPTMGIIIKGGNVSISTGESGGAYMVLDYRSGAPVPCVPDFTEYANCTVMASVNASGSDAVEYNPEDIATYKYVKICHIHSKTEIEAKASTCKTQGWDAYKKCECGQLFDAADNEIDAIPYRSLLAHTYNAGVVTKAPTENETGIKTYTCSVCGATKTEILPVANKSQGQKPGTGSTPASKGETIKDEAGTSYKATKSDVKDGTVTYTKSKSGISGSITIPDTVTINGITYKITAIEANAFKNNKKITKVTIGKNIVTIGKNAFKGCTKLTSVTIGKNVKTIGTSAFSGCSKLKTVKIGASVTTIGDKAFYKCTSLTKITIPAKVSKIGKSAFYGCKKLKNITIKTTKLTSKKVGNKAFKGTPKNAVVKVPKKSLKAYKKFLIKKGIYKKAKIK